MSTCDSGNGYDGRLEVRLSSIFVILIGSMWGAWFPVFAARHKGVGVPEWAFFIAKYFGSGVIVATAFIHVSLLHHILSDLHMLTVTVARTGSRSPGKSMSIRSHN